MISRGTEVVTGRVLQKAELASELELPSLEWRPLGAEGPPANASAVIILAAGRSVR